MGCGVWGHRLKKGGEMEVQYAEQYEYRSSVSPTHEVPFPDHVGSIASTFKLLRQDTKLFWQSIGMRRLDDAWSNTSVAWVTAAQKSAPRWRTQRLHIVIFQLYPRRSQAINVWGLQPHVCRGKPGRIRRRSIILMVAHIIPPVVVRDDEKNMRFRGGALGRRHRCGVF